MGNHFDDAARVWDERYGTSEYVFGVEPNSYLAKQAPLLKAGQRALAVADGEGRNSVWLARQGLLVDAFDISPAGVAKARKLAHDAGVSVNYQVSDCAAWSWNPNVYDVIAAIFIQFADPALRARIFAGMMAALKPGGRLILQGYTPKQLDYNTGGPGVLDNLYTEQMLRAAFSSLEIEALEEYEAELGEGKRHAGLSALVGMVARKPVRRAGDGTAPQ